MRTLQDNSVQETKLELIRNKLSRKSTWFLAVRKDIECNTCLNIFN